jgi:hypothetical protein
LNGALYQIVIVNRTAYAIADGPDDDEWGRLVLAYRECEGFAQAHDALNTGTQDSILAAHALGGDQGGFKLTGWRSRLKAFYRSRRSLRAARRALGWANGILESLAGIPGVGAIKEITGLLERLLAEREDSTDQGQPEPDDKPPVRTTARRSRREGG